MESGWPTVQLNTPLWGKFGDLMVAPAAESLFEDTGKNLAANHKQLHKTQNTKHRITDSSKNTKHETQTAPQTPEGATG